MWARRHFEGHLLKLLPLLSRDLTTHLNGGTSIITKSTGHAMCGSVSCFRLMSAMRGRETSPSMKGRGMRAKVEKRMWRESAKTKIEQRRSKRIHKMLMTEEERLIFNLRRAKKKVALLLQKLKKYELPELPPPLHDPELLTPEQLQAYKKIGFRNRNYVPVGVRGVFGGVVQNMHLHWKFHETVQVCCDNFPKEKIREMAAMLSRLSGGIVVNVHNVKTIIMFRGRNYRQPKNLIPLNTLTKRKALFKARFEQALESQKLNIKKIEQQLRRMGVSPEDPIAMASIQKVASTFFRAIDERQGTPYVFRDDAKPMPESSDKCEEDAIELSQDYSDQEELDKFIADIEQAADLEWEEEEAAEKEEASRIRYWGRDEGGYGLSKGRSQNYRDMDSDGDDDGGGRNRSRFNRPEAPKTWDGNGASHDVSGGEEWELDDGDDDDDDDDDNVIAGVENDEAYLGGRRQETREAWRSAGMKGRDGGLQGKATMMDDHDSSDFDEVGDSDDDVSE